MNLCNDAIPRISQARPSTTSRMALLHETVLNSRGSLDDIAAIVPLPGMGHTDRVSVPVAFYNRSRAQFLLIGGANAQEATYEDLNIQSLQHPSYGLQRTDGVFTKAVTDNTWDQIDWVMHKVKDLNIPSLALFTSPYHLLRSFGTAIQALERLNMEWIPIVPISVGTMDDPVPALCRNGKCYTSSDMVAGEFIRIATYSRKTPPDVASYTQIRDYMSWMRSEHPALALAA